MSSFCFLFYSFQTISILLSFALWFFLRALSSTRTHTLNSRTHWSRTVQYKNYLLLHVHRSWQLEWLLHTHTNDTHTQYGRWCTIYLPFSHLLPRIYMGVRWLHYDFSFTHFVSASVPIEQSLQTAADENMLLSNVV